MQSRNLAALLTAALLVALAALPSCQHAPDPVPPPPPAPESKDAPIRPLTLTKFVLGPGDELDVQVWRQHDLNADCRVNPLGMITLPLVGNVKAAGRDLADVQDDITKGLASYYVEPKVTVGVKTLRSMKIYILGEVQDPGIFYLDEPINIVQAISMAGGFTPDAKRDSVLLARGDLQNPALRKLNLEAALDRGNFGDNVEVWRGDIIYVPASSIANAERFFRRLHTMISPVVDAERGLILLPEVPRSYTQGRRRIISIP